MNSFESDIKEAVTVLETGGLILYPTDTIWGIGCDATNEEAVEKVFALKKRAEEKSLIILVAEERDILKYVASPDLRVLDYLKTTIKPTTVIYDNAIGIASNILSREGSVGIRICRDEFCRHLIKRFRKPVVSTSANISGSPSPAIFNDISEEIKKGVDYTVRYRQNDITIAAPSSVVKWNNDGSVTVLRP
ncbi:MAG: threonylcarbamoyl-AMP synthase [Bacteroidetes bacterium]|nr:threonylcarbamoyl-AMP synthase [Bacteroidota bacterium]